MQIPRFHQLKTGLIRKRFRDYIAKKKLQSAWGINPKKQIGSFPWFINIYIPHPKDNSVLRQHKTQAIPVVSGKTKDRFFISPPAAFAHKEKRGLPQDKVFISHLGMDFVYLQKEANLKDTPLDQLGLPKGKEMLEQLNDPQKRLIFTVFLMVEQYFLSKENRDAGLEIAHMHLNVEKGSSFDVPINNEAEEKLAEKINSRIFGVFFSVFFFHNDWFNEIVDQLLENLERAKEYEEAIDGIHQWLDQRQNNEA